MSTTVYSQVLIHTAESTGASMERTKMPNLWNVRSPKPRCDSCTYIYVHGLCDRDMGLLPASKRHFTVSPHEVFTWFRSAAGSHFKACLPTEEKLSLLGVVRCFWRVLENYDCRTKFNSSQDRVILSWIRPRKPMTRPIWLMCEFLFWPIRSLNFRTFIDALCNNCY